jgi:hypothetical protein
MTDPESKAVRELISTCERIIAWLDRLAAAAEERAKDKRFITLAEANEADARNYRATSADVQKAIKKASAVLR